MFLRENGHPDARRLPLASPDGDIGGVPATLEFKACARMDWTAWFRQLAKSVARTGKPGWLVVKRPGKGVGDALVVQTFQDWVDQHPATGCAAAGCSRTDDGRLERLEALVGELIALVKEKL